MTLKEMALTYREQDEILQVAIKRTRKKLKTEKGEELLKVRRTLLTLYDMSRDLKSTAFILENYYGDDKNGI